MSLKRGKVPGVFDRSQCGVTSSNRLALPLKYPVCCCTAKMCWWNLRAIAKLVCINTSDLEQNVPECYCDVFKQLCFMNGRCKGSHTVAAWPIRMTDLQRRTWQGYPISINCALWVQMPTDKSRAVKLPINATYIHSQPVRQQQKERKLWQTALFSLGVRSLQNNGPWYVNTIWWNLKHWLWVSLRLLKLYLKKPCQGWWILHDKLNNFEVFISTQL